MAIRCGHCGASHALTEEVRTCSAVAVITKNFFQNVYNEIRNDG